MNPRGRPKAFSVSLDVEVYAHCKHVVVAGVVGAVVDALVGAQGHGLARLLVLVEGVEISHVEMCLLADVVDTAKGH